MTRILLMAGLVFGLAQPAFAITWMGDPIQVNDSKVATMWQPFRADRNDGISHACVGLPYESCVREFVEANRDKFPAKFTRESDFFLREGEIYAGPLRSAVIASDEATTPPSDWQEVAATLNRYQEEQAALANEVKALAMEVALLNNRQLNIDDIAGLRARLDEMQTANPNLGGLRASVDRIELFMNSVETGDGEVAQILRDRIVADVVEKIDPRLNALSVRIAAAERGVEELTAPEGIITLMRVDIDRLVAPDGPLASLRADIDALTEDGGRLAIIEGTLTALTEDGGTIPLLQAKLEEFESELAGIVGEDGRLTQLEAAFGELIGEDGRLTNLERQLFDADGNALFATKAELDAVTGENGRLTNLEGRVGEVEDFQGNLWIWGLLGVVTAVGLALIGSHFWTERRSAPTRSRVKKLEDIELTDLEWDPHNADLLTLQPGIENAVVWRVRLRDRGDDWCHITIGREVDTPARKVFADIPLGADGDPGSKLYSIDELPEVDIVLAIKEERLKPTPTVAAVAA